MRKTESFWIKAVLVVILVLFRVPALRGALLKMVGLAPATVAAEPLHRLPTGAGFYAPTEPAFGRPFAPPSADPVVAVPAWTDLDRPGR